MFSVGWIFPQGMSPDLVVANSLVDAYIRCGTLVKAMQILDLMMMSASSEGQVMWPKPDAYTFNTVLRGFVGTGSVDQAMRTIKKMEEMGLSPDEVTVNTLATVCVKAGQLDQALELVKGGGVEGYSAIVDGFAKRGDYQRVSQALTVYDFFSMNGPNYCLPKILTRRALAAYTNRIECLFVLCTMQCRPWKLCM